MSYLEAVQLSEDKDVVLFFIIWINKSYNANRNGLIEQNIVRNRKNAYLQFGEGKYWENVNSPRDEKSDCYVFELFHVELNVWYVSNFAKKLVPWNVHYCPPPWLINPLEGLLLCFKPSFINHIYYCCFPFNGLWRLILRVALFSFCENFQFRMF